jgi:hypothetical protein
MERLPSYTDITFRNSFNVEDAIEIEVYRNFPGNRKSIAVMTVTHRLIRENNPSLTDIFFKDHLEKLLKKIKDNELNP